MLKVENIVVRYGRAEAVRGVSFTAESGGITTLIGANGAGKTTCLRAISGLVPLTSGEIWFEGERIDGRAPEEIARLGIAHVPEGRRIFPYMSVYDNLMTGAFSRKDKAGIQEDLEKVMEYFPVLRSKLKQMARSLSGGEQQMLAFGRAFLLKPKLFVLDEPSLGLAPLLVEAMGRYIKQFAEDGYSIVLVEQNATMALSVAQRAYVLEIGKVALEGNAEDLKVDEHVRKFYLAV